MMGVHWGVVIFFYFGKLCASQAVRPQIANPKFVTNNPTLTTIALEKPFCVFDGSMSKGASYEVYLYVVVDSVTASSASVMDNGDKPLRATFHQTKGGQLGPYKAGTFNVPNCVSPPKLSDATDTAKVQSVLTEYLVRVGNDSACPYDLKLLEACNPPLSEDTYYRFKFVLVDRTAVIVQVQTLWSDPIKTNRLKQSSSIDTWPRQRSGGMMVIASVLSVLMLVVVITFLATLESRESSTTIRYQSQTTQCDDDDPGVDDDPRVEETSMSNH